MTAHARELVDFSKAPAEATHWAMVRGHADTRSWWVDTMHRCEWEGSTWTAAEVLGDAPAFGVELAKPFSCQHRYLNVARDPARRIQPVSNKFLLREFRKAARSLSYDVPDGQRDRGCEHCHGYEFFVNAALQLRCTGCGVVQQDLVVTESKRSQKWWAKARLIASQAGYATIPNDNCWRRCYRRGLTPAQAWEQERVFLPEPLKEAP